MIDSVSTGGNLLQPDVNSPHGQRVKHFVQLLDSIRIDLLTYGAAMHPDVPHEMKMPKFAQNVMRSV